MGRFSILGILFLILVSCSSLQFQVSTLNAVSNRAKFTGFTQPEVLSTDLFSINAPLYSFGGFGSNYMFDWRHYELMQFQFNTWNLYGWNNNNFGIWGWDTYWRYPGNIWAYDQWRYNIPPRSVRPIVRPKVKPRPRVPRLREPRTRVTQSRRLQPTTTRVRINGRRNETNTTNLRRSQQTQSSYNGGRSRSRQVVPTQPVRSRQPRAVQPRPVRRGSGSSSTQQSIRSNSSNQQGRSSGNRKQE